MGYYEDLFGGGASQQGQAAFTEARKPIAQTNINLSGLPQQQLAEKSKGLMKVRAQMAQLQKDAIQQSFESAGQPDRSYTGKLAEGWERGKISFAINKAFDKVRQLPEDERQQAEAELLTISDVYNQAQAEDPLTSDNRVGQWIIDAAQSGQPMAETLLRELKWEAAFTAAGWALAVAEPTPLGEIGMSMLAASKVAKGTKRVVQAGKAVRPAIKMGAKAVHYAGGMYASTKPWIDSGQGMIYENIIRDMPDIDRNVANSVATTGGRIYGAIETTILSPLEMITGGMGDDIVEAAAKPLMKKYVGYATKRAMIKWGTVGGKLLVRDRIEANEEWAQGLTEDLSLRVARILNSFSKDVVEGVEDQILDNATQSKEGATLAAVWASIRDDLPEALEIANQQQAEAEGAVFVMSLLGLPGNALSAKRSLSKTKSAESGLASSVEKANLGGAPDVLQRRAADEALGSEEQYQALLREYQTGVDEITGKKAEADRTEQEKESVRQRVMIEQAAMNNLQSAIAEIVKVDSERESVWNEPLDGATRAERKSFRKSVAEERGAWKEEIKTKMDESIGAYRKALSEAGFSESAIDEILKDRLDPIYKNGRIIREGAAVESGKSVIEKIKAAVSARAAEKAEATKTKEQKEAAKKEKSEKDLEADRKFVSEYEAAAKAQKVDLAANSGGPMIEMEDGSFVGRAEYNSAAKRVAAAGPKVVTEAKQGEPPTGLSEEQKTRWLAAEKRLAAIRPLAKTTNPIIGRDGKRIAPSARIKELQDEQKAIALENKEELQTGLKIRVQYGDRVGTVFKREKRKGESQQTWSIRFEDGQKPDVIEVKSAKQTGDMPFVVIGTPQVAKTTKPAVAAEVDAGAKPEVAATPDATAKPPITINGQTFTAYEPEPSMPKVQNSKGETGVVEALTYDTGQGLWAIKLDTPKADGTTHALTGDYGPESEWNPVASIEQAPAPSATLKNDQKAAAAAVRTALDEYEKQKDLFKKLSRKEKANPKNPVVIAVKEARSKFFTAQDAAKDLFPDEEKVEYDKKRLGVPLATTGAAFVREHGTTGDKQERIIPVNVIDEVIQVLGGLFSEEDATNIGDLMSEIDELQAEMEKESEPQGMSRLIDRFKRKIKIGAKDSTGKLKDLSEIPDSNESGREYEINIGTLPAQIAELRELQHQLIGQVVVDESLSSVLRTRSSDQNADPGTVSSSPITKWVPGALYKAYAKLQGRDINDQGQRSGQQPKHMNSLKKFFGLIEEVAIRERVLAVETNATSFAKRLKELRTAKIDAKSIPAREKAIIEEEEAKSLEGRLKSLRGARRIGSAEFRAELQRMSVAVSALSENIDSALALRSSGVVSDSYKKQLSKLRIEYVRLAASLRKQMADTTGNRRAFLADMARAERMIVKFSEISKSERVQYVEELRILKDETIPSEMDSSTARRDLIQERKAIRAAIKSMDDKSTKEILRDGESAEEGALKGDLINILTLLKMPLRMRSLKTQLITSDSYQKLLKRRMSEFRKSGAALPLELVEQYAPQYVQTGTDGGRFVSNSREVLDVIEQKIRELYVSLSVKSPSYGNFNKEGWQGRIDQINDKLTGMKDAGSVKEYIQKFWIDSRGSVAESEALRALKQFYPVDENAVGPVEPPRYSVADVETAIQRLLPGGINEKRRKAVTQNIFRQLDGMMRGTTVSWDEEIRNGEKRLAEIADSDAVQDPAEAALDGATISEPAKAAEGEDAEEEPTPDLPPEYVGGSVTEYLKEKGEGDLGKTQLGKITTVEDNINRAKKRINQTRATIRELEATNPSDKSLPELKRAEIEYMKELDSLIGELPSVYEWDDASGEILFAKERPYKVIPDTPAQRMSYLRQQRDNALKALMKYENERGLAVESVSAFPFERRAVASDLKLQKAAEEIAGLVTIPSMVPRTGVESQSSRAVTPERVNRMATEMARAEYKRILREAVYAESALRRHIREQNRPRQTVPIEALPGERKERDVKITQAVDDAVLEAWNSLRINQGGAPIPNYVVFRSGGGSIEDSEWRIQAVQPIEIDEKTGRQLPRAEVLPDNPMRMIESGAIRGRISRVDGELKLYFWTQSKFRPRARVFAPAIDVRESTSVRDHLVALWRNITGKTGEPSRVDLYRSESGEAIKSVPDSSAVRIDRPAVGTAQPENYVADLINRYDRLMAGTLDDRYQTAYVRPDMNPMSRDETTAETKKRIEGAGGVFTAQLTSGPVIGTSKFGPVTVEYRYETPPAGGVSGQIRRSGKYNYTIYINPETGDMTTVAHEQTHILRDFTTDREGAVIKNVLGYDLKTDTGDEAFATAMQTEEGRAEIADKIAKADPIKQNVIVRAINRIIDFVNAHFGTKMEHIKPTEFQKLASGLRDMSLLGQLNTDRGLAARTEIGSRAQFRNLSSLIDAVPSKADGSVNMEARQWVLREWKRANPEAVREIDGTPGEQLRRMTLAEQRRRGWNPKWPFIPADLRNDDFVENIRDDATIPQAERDKILSFAPGGKNEFTLSSMMDAPSEPSPLTLRPDGTLAGRRMNGNTDDRFQTSPRRTVEEILRSEKKAEKADISESSRIIEEDLADLETVQPETKESANFFKKFVNSARGFTENIETAVTSVSNRWASRFRNLNLEGDRRKGDFDKPVDDHLQKNPEVLAAMRKIKMDKKEQMKDASGNDMKGFRTAHRMTLAMYSRMAKLSKYITIWDRGGLGAVNAAIEAIPDEAVRAEEKKMIVAFMGSIKIENKEKSKETITGPNTKIKFTINGQTRELTARQLLQMQNELSSDEMEWITKVADPIYEMAKAPLFAEIRQVRGRDVPNIENYAPIIRELGLLPREGLMVKEASTTWNQDNTKLSATQARGYSSEPMRLLGAGELMIKHIEDVGKYLAYTRMAVEMQGAVQINKAKLMYRLGKERYEALSYNLDSLEGIHERVQIPGANIANKLLSRYGGVVLRANPYVAAMQVASVTAFARAFGGWGVLARGIAMSSTSEGQQLIRRLRDMNSQLDMRYRHGGRGGIEASALDVTENRYLAEYKNYSRAGQWSPIGGHPFLNFASKLNIPIRFMDKITLDAGLLTAYQSALDQGLTGEEAIRWAADEGAKAINSTQVNSTPPNMSIMRKSTNPLVRAVAFMSGATQAAYNMWARDIAGVFSAKSREEASDAWQKLALSTSSVVVGAMFIAAIKASRNRLRRKPDDDGEDEETFMKDWLWSLSESIVSIAPANSAYSPAIFKTAAKMMNDKDRMKRYAWLQTSNPYDSVAGIGTSTFAGLNDLHDAIHDDSLSDGKRQVKMASAYRKMIKGGNQLLDLYTAIPTERLRRELGDVAKLFDINQK
jgi:hypothetical protein